MLETGHTAFRTSIQWSRIFPEGRGEINQAGVDFYRRVFEKIKEKGIHPWSTSIILILLMVLQEQGDGWENKETAYAYQEYARFVSRPMEIWSTSGSPLMNPLSLWSLVIFMMPIFPIR